MQIPEPLLDQKEIIVKAFSDPTSVGNNVLLALFENLASKRGEYDRKIRMISGEKESYRKSAAILDAVVKNSLTTQALDEYTEQLKSALQEGEELPATVGLPEGYVLPEPPAIVKQIRAAIVAEEATAERRVYQLQGEKAFCEHMLLFMKQIAKGLENLPQQPAQAPEKVIDPAALDEAIAQGAAAQTQPPVEPAPKTPLQLMVEEYEAAGKCSFVERGAGKPCGLKPASKSTPYCRKHK